MARRPHVSSGVAERMLMSKLQILNGATGRRTSLALSMLTGRTIEPWTFVANVQSQSYPSDEPTTAEPPVLLAAHRHGRQYAARTVYLSERHLQDVDQIIQAWQQVDSRRLTRSAVLRRAVEYLRDAVEADPAKCKLESD
jgi:hypothetical protein